jgi:hypothetical protein
MGSCACQRRALERFLGDGRLPIHNNQSEQALRREAVGRKNWIGAQPRERRRHRRRLEPDGRDVREAHLVGHDAIYTAWNN